MIEWDIFRGYNGIYNGIFFFFKGWRVHYCYVYFMGISWNINVNRKGD